MATIRILLVDDFAPFRSYVCRIFEEHPKWQVVGEAADGITALQKAKDLQPDVILLDVNLPLLHGIEVAQQLGVMVPGCKILFLSAHSAPDTVQAAFAAGAWGYVIKWNTDRDLLRAMEAVMAGKQFLSERLAGQA